MTATSSPARSGVDTPVVDGRNVKLTIDADLQWYAQNALAKQVTGVGALSGTAVVIEVATGKIRAAASYPTFDPNADNPTTSGRMTNEAFDDAFEPGSTGKLMTMAAALEQKVITPDTGVIVAPAAAPRRDELQGQRAPRCREHDGDRCHRQVVQHGHDAHRGAGLADGDGEVLPRLRGRGPHGRRLPRRVQG